ncbi:MAG: guanylate kinase [Bacillota bacterium]
MIVLQVSDRSPILFVVSGPSGSGKGTVIAHLLESFANLERIVTYTTRSPREDEIDGVHYRFISEDRFQKLLREGEIFEYERVYEDYYYASPANVLSGGVDRIIEVDYKGHRKFRAAYPTTVSLFLLPPSMEELERRIRSRSPEDNMKSRLRNAREQIRRAGEYDYLLVNEHLEPTLMRARAIVAAERVLGERERLLRRWDIPDRLSENRDPDIRGR